MKKLIIVLLIIIPCFQASAIQQIRWGSTGDPLNGLTITWRNTGLSDSIRWGYDASMTNGTFAGIRRAGYADYFFDYAFPSVTANSTIFYILYDSYTTLWGTQQTFKTAPPVNTTTFSFLGLGDSRTNMTPWSQVASHCNSKISNFTIFTGDIVEDGSTNSEWDNWFNNGTQFIQNSLFYHCIGNHDASDTAKYENIFTLPMAENTKLHYYFTYGNAIFICMNTENITTSEYNWMVSILQANQSKTWKVLFFHRPFFTIGEHAGEMNAELSTWWAAFDTYGVDLILNGHDHMYERSKPINYSVSHTSPVTEYGSGPGQGRCEIVCGGAGAPLYTGVPAWFTQTYQSNYNFCKLSVNDCIITDSTFNNSGALIETFSINKCSSGIENHNPIGKTFYCEPNPTAGSFTLHYNSPLKGEAVISVMDMKGRTVAKAKAQKTGDDFDYRLDLSKNTKGVYIVQIEIGSIKENLKLELK
jgi:hypothetical protein